VSELAGNVLALDARLKELDAQIAATFDLHPQAAIITSMPGSARSWAPRCWLPPVTWPRSRPPGT